MEAIVFLRLEGMPKENATLRKRRAQKREVEVFDEVPGGLVVTHKNSLRLTAPPTSHIWISVRVAAAILQVTTGHIYKLKKSGDLRGGDGVANLADVLERYHIILRTTGALNDQAEAISMREFANGKIPREVIIEHGFPVELVKKAWKHHCDINHDPVVQQILADRETKKRREDALRCRDCLRTPEAAAADALEILRSASGDPTRTASLSMREERALVDLDIRCPSCRVIKATAPVDIMRARLRLLRVMPEPKPIDVDKEMPLPVSPTPADSIAPASPPTTLDAPAPLTTTETPAPATTPELANALTPMRVELVRPGVQGSLVDATTPPSPGEGSPSA